MSAEEYTMPGDGSQEVPGEIEKFVQQRGFLIAFAVIDFVLGVGSGFLNGKNLKIFNLYNGSQQQISNHPMILYNILRTQSKLYIFSTQYFEKIIF